MTRCAPPFTGSGTASTDTLSRLLIHVQVLRGDQRVCDEYASIPHESEANAVCRAQRSTLDNDSISDSLPTRPLFRSWTGMKANLARSSRLKGLSL